ncbi:MAG TPA: esterase [Polaromonas sp.]|jgi:phospholipase/carboxylesterase
MNPLDTETIELLSAAASPRPLFVLLHDAGETAADMLALGNLLGDAFAESAVLIPQELVGPAPDPVRVEALAAFVRAQQQRFEVLQSDTALAGFGAGADLALALSDAHDGLVGRVLAFGAAYPARPDSFEKPPLLTLLHLLHGENDRVVPASQARAGFDRLMARSADATLDVARSVGHELHPALMDQAVTRLQTCVPLRHWRAV